MAYIGKTPITGNFVKLDAISVVNGQASYTMNNGGSAFTDYENVNQFLVSLNGILQAPTDSFTVSGSTLTFASNLATGDVIDFVIVLGNTLDIGTPSDATVTQAKTNFVSTSSSAGLQIKGDGTTDGTLQLNCSQNSHGIKLKSPAHSAGASYTLTFPTTDGNANEFLQTNGSGVLTWASAGGGITEADCWRLTANTSSSGVLSSNWERVDDDTFGKLGTGMTESSGIFSFPSTGVYLIDAFASFTGEYTSSYNYYEFQTTPDNSTYTTRMHIESSHEGNVGNSCVSMTTLVDVTDTSNIKFKFNCMENTYVIKDEKPTKHYDYISELNKIKKVFRFYEEDENLLYRDVPKNNNFLEISGSIGSTKVTLISFQVTRPGK